MASDGIGVAAAADMLLGAVTAAEKSSEDAQALSLARSQAFHALRSLLLALRDTKEIVNKDAEKTVTALEGAICGKSMALTVRPALHATTTGTHRKRCLGDPEEMAVPGHHAELLLLSRVAPSLRYRSPHPGMEIIDSVPNLLCLLGLQGPSKTSRPSRCVTPAPSHVPYRIRPQSPLMCDAMPRPPGCEGHAPLDPDLHHGGHGLPLQGVRHEARVLHPGHPGSHWQATGAA